LKTLIAQHLTPIGVTVSIIFLWNDCCRISATTAKQAPIPLNRFKLQYWFQGPDMQQSYNSSKAQEDGQLRMHCSDATSIVGRNGYVEVNA
jgi:hypothetical protein